MIEVIPVIITDLFRRGGGPGSEDIVRSVRQIYTLKGELLAEIDDYEKCPHCGKYIRPEEP